MSWCWLEKEAEQGLWCGEVPNGNLMAHPFEMMSWELCFACLAVGNAGTCSSLFPVLKGHKGENDLLSEWSPFLLGLLYESPFPLQMKKMSGLLLGKMNTIWKLNRSLHTWRISMNNTMLLFQWPHPDHTQLWYLSWRHCRSQEGSFSWLKDMKPLFLGCFGL